MPLSTVYKVKINAWAKLGNGNENQFDLAQNNARRCNSGAKYYILMYLPLYIVYLSKTINLNLRCDALLMF